MHHPKEIILLKNVHGVGQLYGHAEFVSALQTERAVLTPHPGEAARLLNIQSADVQMDRLAALQQITASWEHTCVLKGAGTLVGQHEAQIALCRHGHAGMATAGMGDVLSGMIAGYLAQGLSPLDSAQTAVLLHALAAEDHAVDEDENSLIASDVIDRLGGISKRIRTLQAGD